MHLFYSGVKHAFFTVLVPELFRLYGTVNTYIHGYIRGVCIIMYTYMKYIQISISNHCVIHIWLPVHAYVHVFMYVYLGKSRH